MPLCTYCKKLSPVGLDRCAYCGKWISLDPEPSAADQSSAETAAGVDLKTPETGAGQGTPSPARSGLPTHRTAAGQPVLPATFAKPVGPANFAAQSAAASPASALHQQLVELMATGRKIEAIKIYREQTGASLADAKRYVENLGSAEIVQAELATVGRTSSDGPLEIQLVALLRQGKKIEAIKLFRQKTRCDLREANRQMQILAKRHQIPESNATCGPALAVILLVWVVMGLLAKWFS